MRTETLSVEQAIERLDLFEPPLGRLERVYPAEADVLAARETELIFVDCTGLCEE